MRMHPLLMGGAARGLPRNGLVALYDPYRDAYGRNVLGAGAADFATEWTKVAGTTVTVTAGQADPDGGTGAYLVETSGGTDVYKYWFSNTPPAAGTRVQFRMWVHNVGETVVRCGFKSPVNINPGESQWVTEDVVWVSGNMTPNFQAVNISDSLSFVVYHLQVNLGPVLHAYSAPAGAPGTLQTLTDYSGLGNHGTLGATTGASTDDPAFTGTALSFDGGDFVGATVSGIAANGARSLLTVFGSTTDTAARNLVSTGGMGTRKAFGLSKNAPTNKLQCYTYADDLVSNWVLDANNHIACGTYDGARGLKLYYDSNATPATQTLSGDLDVTSTAFRLGRTTWGSEFWDDDIFLVAYYNRCLSASEYLRAYRYLKSLMAGRGVTVA